MVGRASYGGVSQAAGPASATGETLKLRQVHGTAREVEAPMGRCSDGSNAKAPNATRTLLGQQHPAPGPRAVVFAALLKSDERGPRFGIRFPWYPTG